MTNFPGFSRALRFVAAVFGFAACLPAFAGVAVSSPGNGATVSAPFTVSATASQCSSQNIASMAYSVDSGSDQNIVYTGSLNTSVSASAGNHTVHVKAWGNQGASCVTDVAVNVTGTTSATSGDAVVPSYATSVSSIQALGNWVAQHDGGTSGSSSGSMNLTSSPSYGGTARAFYTSFSNSGGELYHVTFGDDVNATNFFYDAWLYIAGSAANIANLEMDMNQVMSNGWTVIYGFQCDGYSGTWDYTKNAGSPSSPYDTWVHSSAKCNPRSWATNAWHHVQVSYSRDGSGNVTYKSVWLDGAEQMINATVPSAFALGWGPVILTNFQVDGLGNGSATTYLDDVKVSRW